MSRNEQPGGAELIEVSPELRVVLRAAGHPAAAWKKIPGGVLRSLLAELPERERRRLALHLRALARDSDRDDERAILPSVADGLERPAGGLREAVESATQAARVSKRHAPMKDAAEWVRGEWPAARESYGGSRSRFARDMAARLKRERGLEVTERTISESWLKGL